MEKPTPPQKKSRLPLLALASVLIVAGAAEGIPKYLGLGWVTRSNYRQTYLALRERVASRLEPGPKRCSFDNPVECSATEFCAYVEPKVAECVPRYVGSAPLILFPFDPKEKAVCVSGPNERSEEHSFAGSYYAIDLAIVPRDAPAPQVYSAFSGTAIVYDGCKYDSQPNPRPRNDSCGGGFGNHVRVLSSDGVMVTYAHLGKVTVQDGQIVRAGDSIGMVGNSGRAAFPHLHLSVHAVPSSKLGSAWLETLYYYRNHPGIMPPSIPFEMQYCDPADQNECVRRRSRVENLPCHTGDFKQPPIRADWRS